VALTDRRSDPDELLARVAAEEAQRGRGRLRIFLGYAAGVGKTYAMLEAARQRQEEGADIVVGFVETHGRSETERLLEGLEIVPRKPVSYRGITLEEMDVDAILARQPQFALVDELAHTNVAGSRHLKRYQDVLDLLGAGVDVYTTLNVQHLESLRDVVAQITGVHVRETVPDGILDEATEIELIDVSPEELLQRLKEGKVYVSEQAQWAIQRFFRRGNLTALREIAMRQAARRVDRQMRVYMRNQAISGPWPAGERIVVCVSSDSLGERLVRAARRLAADLNAEWFAIYVEMPDRLRLSPDERTRVDRTLRLAEELGAETRTLPGHSISEALIDFARRNNITKIIVGKSIQSRWHDMVRGSVVDRLIRASGDIDVYVVSQTSQETDVPHRRTHARRRAWQPYLASIGLSALVTLVGLPLRRFVHPTNLVMLYLLAVGIVAARWGRGPSALASLVGVLFFDFFFVDPRLTFTVEDTQYLITFLGLFGIGLAISQLESRAREQALAAQRREIQTASLYAFSRLLTRSSTLDEISEAIVKHLEESFHWRVVVLIPEGGRLVTRAKSPGAPAPDESELAIAAWVLERGKPAGRETDTLTAATMRYVPLRAPHSVVGVLGIQLPVEAGHLSPEERQYIDTIAAQASLAIWRTRLDDQAREHQVALSTERLQTALLGSISHDLRTPLVTIMGVLSTLKERETRLDEAIRQNLIESAEEEADRLNRLVGNLLDMTRLEAGTLRLRAEPCDVSDVIGSALEQLSTRLYDRQVSVRVPADAPLVTLDFVLMQQVLVNLLDNALKFSAGDTPVEVWVRPVGDEIEIEVADRGIGIPPGELARVFDKMYRVQRPQAVSGSGLGLTICKGIVEAHGGRIVARNRPGGGTIVTVSLPVGDTDTEAR